MMPETIGQNAETGMRGWRFVHADGSSKFQKTPQAIGVRQTIPTDKKSIKVTRWGLHASLDPLDAVGQGAGFYVERVLLTGTIDRNGWAVAASERTVLWRADARLLLAGFAADCAERAVKYLTDHGITPTPQTARYIGLARAFATGELHETALHDETDGAAYTEGAETGAAQAEQAAIHAACIFAGYECVDCALFDAAEAISEVAERDPSQNVDKLYNDTRLWQAYELHDRLMKLAPDEFKDDVYEPA